MDADVQLALVAIANELGIPAANIPSGVAGVLLVFRAQCLAAGQSQGHKQALEEIARVRFGDDESPTPPYPIGHPLRKEPDG